MPDKPSRQRSSARRKIPACRSTERCPGGILSLRRQSQIPTEIDGLLGALRGEPFIRQRWLLAICGRFWVAAWQTDKYKSTGRKRELLTGRETATHTQRGSGLLVHSHRVTDWQARWRWRQTESWHMHITHAWGYIYAIVLDTHTHMCTPAFHSPTQQPSVSAFQPYFTESWNVRIHTWIFVHYVYWIQHQTQVAVSPLQTDAHS